MNISTNKPNTLTPDQEKAIAQAAEKAAKAKEKRLKKTASILCASADVRLAQERSKESGEFLDKLKESCKEARLVKALVAGGPMAPKEEFENALEAAKKEAAWILGDL